LTTIISSRPHRIALRALLAAAALVLVLTAAGPAAGAATCGKKVIDDWYDNGRVDGSYPLHCYDDAIDALPRDVRDYSSAKDDIERALQARMNGQEAPPATSDPTPQDPGSTTGGSDDGDNTDGEGTAGPGDPTKPGDESGVPEAGAGDVDTASSDSVPVPLLVLAGLALLLVAAGSVGYLARRLQARRLPPTA
jgi:cobalamin biosynthesis Mg chelatase CobN